MNKNTCKHGVGYDSNVCYHPNRKHAIQCYHEQKSCPFLKSKEGNNNPSGISRATFATLEEAKEWREKNGGRIFVSDDGFSPEWFSLDWLPTDVLMSAHGSGRII